MVLIMLYYSNRSEIELYIRDRCVVYPTKNEGLSMKIAATDPRVKRTRGLLREALMGLATEKWFSRLTIKDVTSQAGLDRTTFYLHYGGLHDLLEDCARDLFNQMRAEIYAHKTITGRKESSGLEPFVESVFCHLEKHKKIYRIILGKQGDPLFRALFQELLSELIFEPIAREAPGAGSGHQYDMVL